MRNSTVDGFEFGVIKGPLGGPQRAENAFPSAHVVAEWAVQAGSGVGQAFWTDMSSFPAVCKGQHLRPHQPGGECAPGLRTWVFPPPDSCPLPHGAWAIRSPSWRGGIIEHLLHCKSLPEVDFTVICFYPAMGTDRGRGPPAASLDGYGFGAEWAQGKGICFEGDGLALPCSSPFL